MNKITEHFNWEEFSIKDIEKKHDVTAVAKRDGQGDEPRTNAEKFSVCENEIKQECETYIERHTAKLRTFLEKIEQKQNELSTYLQQNHFEPIYDKLKLEFDALAGKSQMLLGDYKNSYSTYKEEQKQFQRYHQISRESNFATPRKSIKAFGLILFLLAVEIFANANLLSGALVGGTKAGLTLAGSVAFINVFISSIVGYYILKNVTHLEKAKKYLYGVIGLIYAILILYLNACLGAYRAISEFLFNKEYSADPNVVKLTDEQIRIALNESIIPWGVDFSFTGIVLTFLGISFAFISLLDGFTYNDTYPGYGNVGKNVNKYNELIKEESHNFAGEVNKLLDKGNKELQNKKDQILNQELNYWDNNTNLLQKEFIAFEQKTKDVEHKCRHIVEEYRGENKRVRKTEAPKYFQKSFEVIEEIKNPEKVFKEIVFHYLNDQSRETKKIKFSEKIEEYFKIVEKEFEELVSLTSEKQKSFHEKYSTY
ncbi:MAG: hypothetical protein ACJZ3C_02805 [Pelagibacteraceae bacterium]